MKSKPNAIQRAEIRRIKNGPRPVFALIPKRLSDGRWVWLETVYGYYWEPEPTSGARLMYGCRWWYYETIQEAERQFDSHGYYVCGDDMQKEWVDGK